MSALSQKTVANFQAVLSQWSGLLAGTSLAGSGKALETFVALETADTICICSKSLLSVELRDGKGNKKTNYVPRGGPGRINGMGPPDPTHVYIAATSHRTNALVELEVHQSVQWECRLGSFHELDVCVIKLRRSSQPRDQLGKARRLLGVECKQWARPADLGVGRQAFALRSLLLTRRQAIVTTGATNKNLETFVTALGTRHSYFAAARPYGMNITSAPILLGFDVVKDVGV